MAPYIASWGILGCGWISSKFVRDIALPRPSVTDVTHAVVAAGTQDSKDRAEAFLAEHIPKGASAQIAGLAPPPVGYGSYGEVINHPDVNIIYIGTLHPSHYDLTLACLKARKHVLVEKPAVINAAEWASLVQVAKEQNVFLMEAFWTRFQPAVQRLWDVLHVDKAIGEVRGVTSDLSFLNYNVLPDTHRIMAMEAAGGALLDLGAYVMVPARIALHDNPLNTATPSVTAKMSKTRMGTDLCTSMVLDYASLGARAVCTTGFNARTPHRRTATIVGTEGEIVIHNALYRITEFTVYQLQKKDGGEEEMVESETVKMEIEGMGLNLEADAVARDVRDGRVENALVSHKYTAETLEIFDEARRQGGFVLPVGMEKVGRVGVDEQ